MCGVFGIIVNADSGLNLSLLHGAAREIFRLSETRGKDASGALAVLPDRIEVLKSAQRVGFMIGQPEFSELIGRAASAYEQNSPFVVAGHSRMATNGTEYDDFNNQPVIRGQHVILHNGIIVNDARLWSDNPSLQRLYQVDTEIFAALLSAKIAEGCSLVKAVQAAFAEIRGANTIAVFSQQHNQLVIGTTNGSMYFWRSLDRGVLVFASERLIVERVAKRLKLKNGGAHQLKRGQALAVDLAGGSSETFSLGGSPPISEMPPVQRRKLVKLSFNDTGRRRIPAFSNKLAEIEHLMAIDQSSLRLIHRCTRCLLPETFPFIDFDGDGVCQLCRTHQPRRHKGEDALKRLADESRRSDGEADCLVPISGGRDSCYGLHYVKNELNLSPVAYTYDWGFVTDLARRNISRMCGSLGIEHVLVAADIRQKRENVRKNVSAWLKKPTLGMIPLFMAGDKMFFYYASLIRRQMNLRCILFSMNWLEQTGFKTGYAGINEMQVWDPGVQRKTYGLGMRHAFQLLGYYAGELAKNPIYLNSSISDTLFAYFSYYMHRKDYYSIFDYMQWDQKLIERTIVDGYDWETSPDTSSTWRIGDGTAPFYNYIYLTVGGFSEHDTFRSNQIREGLITREEALSAIERENQPRPESFKWYCDTVGLDAIDALKVINKIPKLYAH